MAVGLSATSGVAPIRAVGDGPIVAVMTVSGWVGASVGGTTVSEGVTVTVMVAVGRAVGKTGSALELHAAVTKTSSRPAQNLSSWKHRRKATGFCIANGRDTSIKTVFAGG